ncbi:MAG: site-specific DNA-methyltransferase [Deltaproteobacteria bacterium]|nr:MAG: site-specific DNA-methyltransferase [Deltaproteobacteria bacterium]
MPVELIWDGKRKEVERVSLPFQIVEIVNEPRPEPGRLRFPIRREDNWRNKLIWGDNKVVMSSLLKEFAGKINLIYIDPPFATGADFSLKMKIGDLEWTKQPSIIEELAYRDTWGRGLDSYLQMMYERLVLMRELLADNGSIYVHLDWHVGHYVKTIMDEVFGKENFRNEISWRKLTAAKAQSKFFSNVKDMILLYSKSDNATFNPQFIKSEKDDKNYPYVEEGTGRRYGSFDFTQKGSGPPRYFGDKLLYPPPGKHWIWDQEKINKAMKEGRIIFTSSGLPRIKRYLDEKKGNYLGDLWVDEEVAPLSANSSERTGFDTQKPEALLKRIILASSNEGDLVADFFCGSGTTLVVAEKLNRKWIGCDLSKFAIHTTRKRMLDTILELYKQGQSPRPFEVLNLGNYQKFKFAENGHDTYKKYLDFMLKLYQAQPIKGTKYLHGRKGNYMVMIGPLDAIVTARDVEAAARECADVGSKKLDILAWEFEMGLHDLVDEIGRPYGVNITLKQIPHQVVEIRNPEKEEIRFFDLNYLDLDVKVKGKTVTIIIKDFIIANPEYVPQEVRKKIKKFSDWIDYWAVDWNYQNDTFTNGWQSFRTKKRPKLELSVNHTYEECGRYKILVKVIDIFGNDTNKLVEVEV